MNFAGAIARTEADNREQIDERGKICARKQHQTPADFYRGYERNCYEYRIDDQRDEDDPVDHVIVRTGGITHQSGC